MQRRGGRGDVAHSTGTDWRWAGGIMRKTPNRLARAASNVQHSPHSPKRTRPSGSAPCQEPHPGRLFWGVRVGLVGLLGRPGAGGVSKSATKAPRTGIGRGGNRGTSTILLARPDSIGAFVADLDTDRVRTGSDWSHATRAPHLSQVPLLAAPPGAEHGAPGGSFRSAPDCEAIRTAQSCGNRRTHPGRGPERSSQGTRIGSGPRAPLAPDPAAERPCNRFGHTPPHKPHTPHSDTPRITFRV